MATSTVLSLLYVPVAYTYFDSFGTLLGKLFHWRPRLRFGRVAQANPTVAVDRAVASNAPSKALRAAPAIRLLVVDDAPAVRRGLQMRLALEGDLRVIGEAGSGEEALTVVRALEPDVVLMDIEMPGMGGLATTQALRSFAPGSAVVTLSLHDDAESRARALAAGATAAVGKQAASEALLAAIRDAAHRAA